MAEAANRTETFTHKLRFAYFSMEIALENDIPTYSGGLGVLAGDSLRAAADIGVPMVAVTLVSRAGYFRQAIDPQGWQVELADDWDPARTPPGCRPPWRWSWRVARCGWAAGSTC